MRGGGSALTPPPCSPANADLGQKYFLNNFATDVFYKYFCLNVAIAMLGSGGTPGMGG